MGAGLIYEVLDAPLGDPPRPDMAAAKSLGRAGRGRRRALFLSTGRGGDRGLDLVAEPSQTTALVGPSGGGKSTILGLIQRFYTPSGGRILIDGQDLADVDLASIRDKIAFVSQDVFLFRGTIRDNIALGKPGADATKRSRRRRARRTRTTSSCNSPTATTPMSANRARSYRAASASASPSPARS